MSMPDRPEDANLVFTIIVPAYNVEKYIENCLDSLLNQEISNYEIIINSSWISSLYIL